MFDFTLFNNRIGYGRNMVVQSFIWILVLLNLSCVSVLHKEELNTRKGATGASLHWGPWDFPLNILISSEVSNETYDRVVKEATHISNVVGCTTFSVSKIDKNDFRVVIHKHRDVLVSYNITNPFNDGEIHYQEATLPGYLYATEVYLNEKLKGDYLNKVIRHELLHVLGLDHDSSKRSVLYKWAGISEGDIEGLDVDYIRNQCL
jgi:hypothetical protein